MAVYISNILVDVYMSHCSGGEQCEHRNRAFHVVKELKFLCVAGQLNAVKSTSVRIIILTSYMTSLVLMAAYSACLISSLAVQRRHLPFNDLQGLLHDGSYRLGVVMSSSTFNIFDVWRLEYL